MVLNCFGRTSQVYALTAGITRDSGLYVFAVKTIGTLIINLLIFIWLLQKVILHLKTLYVILLQINKSKHVNFAI